MRVARWFVALLIPVLGLFAGCSHKDQPKQQLTYTQLLTGIEKKAWRITSYELFDNDKSGGVQPIESLVQACEADDQFVFYASEAHKFEYTNGPSKCDIVEPDVIFTDTWALLNDNSVLEFMIPVLGGKVSWVVKELTERVLTVEYFSPDLNLRYRFSFRSAT